MNSKGRVLLAEDDNYLRLLIKEAMEENGYTVTECQDGQAAINTFNKNNFDISLLDVMMPLKDGFMVAKKIRQQSDLHPIIFISTKGMLEDRLKGYLTGADDYITKPFSMKELLMKIDVFLRRSKPVVAEQKEEFSFGDTNFSYSDLSVTTPASTFTLQQKEADLLRFLCSFPNRILKREEILLAVWNKDDFFLGRSMDVYMTKLRKYLRSDEKVNIETIHGVGFRFSVS